MLLKNAVGTVFPHGPIAYVPAYDVRGVTYIMKQVFLLLKPIFNFVYSGKHIIKKKHRKCLVLKT